MYVFDCHNIVRWLSTCFEKLSWKSRLLKFLYRLADIFFSSLADGSSYDCPIFRPFSLLRHASFIWCLYIYVLCVNKWMWFQFPDHDMNRLSMLLVFCMMKLKQTDVMGVINNLLNFWTFGYIFIHTWPHTNTSNVWHNSNWLLWWI